MKASMSVTLILALGLLAVLPAQAQYLVTSRGEVARNAYGECWHTSSWTPADAIVGCDGKVAEPKPEPVAEPEPPKPAPEPRVETVVLDADTYFDFDKATLRPSAEATLDQLVERVKGYTEVESIRIVGHADRIGPEGYNQRLSERRASSVRDYLVERKALHPDRITVKGMGESQPVKTCEGIRGQALIDCLQPNRRVEVKIKCTRCEPR